VARGCGGGVWLSFLSPQHAVRGRGAYVEGTRLYVKAGLAFLSMTPEWKADVPSLTAEPHVTDPFRWASAPVR